MNPVTSPQSRCRFGIASGDVTPPVGMYHRMWGAAKHDQSTGVHRPLRATAAVFQSHENPTGPGSSDSNSEQILVAVDHCVLGADELSRIVEAVAKAVDDVETDQIAVVCSHTHAAGLLSLDRVSMPGGDLIPGYLDSLVATIAGLVVDARRSVQPASIVYGVGRCDLAAHRDLWDDEAGRYVCGYNPEVAADDAVLVARVDDGSGNTLATVVNYACHPTTLAWDNTLVSPDFPGATREVVEHATGAPCLFLQGASGDLGPREGFTGDVEVADRNGRQLGYAALEALEAVPDAGTQFVYTGPVESGATIGTWAHRPVDANALREFTRWGVSRAVVDLPYRSDLETAAESESELNRLETAESEARSRGDESTAQEHRANAERRRRALARRRSLPACEAFPWRASIWRIGDAAWVALQGEPYSLFQTELRSRFPDVPVVVASVGFSWGVAYLPPKESYGKGIYQETVAVVAPGSLETAIDAVAEHIKSLFAP